MKVIAQRARNMFLVDLGNGKARILKDGELVGPERDPEAFLKNGYWTRPDPDVVPTGYEIGEAP